MKHITVTELRDQIKAHDAPLLIDVREPYEHEDYNIGGTLMPLSELFEHIDKIPGDVPVVVYCRMGIRSQIAIQRLEAKFGFRNLINLQGGIEAWRKTDPN